MKRVMLLALFLLTACGVANAKDGAHWTALTPGMSYGVRPVESKPFIVLAAVRGDTLSEPLNIGFYVLSSPACKALANPVDGPATGSVGSVGLVEIDGLNYALDGWCDGGNLTMIPSFWINRQALLKAVRNDAVLDVWFKDNPPPGFHLHYQTAGFSRVLKGLDVTLPQDQVANAPALPSPASGKCSAPPADYPIQAMRMNQQGVVDVGFSVTAGGHTSNLSVESSSGSPALDAAALAAVSRAICNVPAGTHASLPVTFGLGH
jgi:TonB family protein